MAGRKKKVAPKAARTAKRPVKAVPRKAKTASAKAKPKAGAKKKSLFAKAVGKVTSLLRPKKAPPSREFGEGNYKASKRFRDDQEAFVKKNKSKIPALGKAAEDALAGPEGNELRAAEASAAGHAAD
ncbi:MAG TPA: hypothetical protein VII56_06345 [Rhizomicrobium sp.]